MIVSIGIIGDYNSAIVAHQATQPALELAAQSIGVVVKAQWIATDKIRSPDDLLAFGGLWCVPGSPYRSMGGALTAIRHARESGLPFFGTCGGFQHAIIEYARNAMGWSDAEHAETAPDATCAVISPLACALVEVQDTLILRPGSRLARAYGKREISEGYHCRYGLNDAFRQRLTAGPLRDVAHDVQGEVRAVELDNHPFFVATLFQPERAALRGIAPPPVAAFVNAVLTRSQ